MSVTKVSMATRPPKRVGQIKPKRYGSRGHRGQLLEQCVHGLKMMNIQSYTQAEFDKSQVRPDEFVLLNYSHPSLYGTEGRKEAYINLNGVEVVVEAKYQQGSGSVDEKLPYIWECFLVSSIPVWIVVFDGKYWAKHPRGEAALEWFRQHIGRRRVIDCVPPERKLYICTLKSFFDLIRELATASRENMQ
jgi:hypothetical protein